MMHLQLRYLKNNLDFVQGQINYWKDRAEAHAKNSNPALIALWEQDKKNAEARLTFLEERKSKIMDELFELEILLGLHDENSEG